jgi:hypothetical protein
MIWHRITYNLRRIKRQRQPRYHIFLDCWTPENKRAVVIYGHEASIAMERSDE